jgi:hypothetical protein
MFGRKEKLPTPSNIAPNQPFPYLGVYWNAVYLLAAGLLLALVLWVISPKKEVFHETYSFKALATGLTSTTQLVPQRIALRGSRNIRISLIPKGSPGWVQIQGELVAGSGARANHPFSLLAGERTAWAYMSAVPRGEYELKFTAAWQNPQSPVEMEVRIEQGVAHPWPLMMALLLLGALPAAVALYQLYFTARRWQDSNVKG